MIRTFLQRIDLVLWTALLALLTASCGGETTGGLQGVIQLEGRSEYEGIEVALPGTQFRAQTDMDGAFLILGVPPGDYTLTAAESGFTQHREEVSVAAGRRSTIDRVTLSEIREPAGSITGFVSAEGASTNENIAVMLVGHAISTMTNTTGFYRLNDVPPGDYMLFAFKQGWQPATAEVTVNDGEETQLDELNLPSTVVAVQSTEASPDALGDRVLRGAAFLQGREEHDGIRVYLDERPAFETVTSASGFFELKGLDEQPYTLIFSYPDFIDRQLPDVTPFEPGRSGGVGYITLEPEIKPDQVGILQGRVYLDGQATHANTLVRLLGVSQSVVTGDDGRYMFIAIPQGDYALTAEHPGYETGRIDSVRVASEQILQAPDLTLSATRTAQSEETGEIRGRALLQDRNDHGGITVAIEGTGFSAVTAIDGSYLLSEVPYGAYTLVFTRGGYKNAYYEGVNVPPGESVLLELVALQPDVDPPYVVETFPRDGARRVPVIEFVDIVVRFSERMAGDSVKNSVLIEPPVDFQAFFDRESEFSDLDVLHIRLNQMAPNPVQLNTDYRVTILPEARTPKGVPMAEPYQFRFATDGPLIIRTEPESGTRGAFIATFQPFLIFTNVPVNPVSFERSLRIRPQPDAQPSYEYYPAGAGTRIQVNTLLRPETRYRFQIDNGLRSQEGQRFSNTPYLVSFTTVEMGGRQRPRGGFGERGR